MSRRRYEDRLLVVAKYLEGKSRAQIVRETQFNKRFVYRWIDAYETNDHQPGWELDQPRRKGKRKLTESEKKEVLKYTRKRHKSTRVVAQELKEEKGIDVSYKTVGRTFVESGFKPLHRQRVQKLTEKHKKRRLAFGKKYNDAQWHKFIFSDETPFEHQANLNTKNDIVWAKNTSEVPPLEKGKWEFRYPCWGAIGYNSKTNLCPFSGTLSADGYIDILRKELIPFMEQHYQDNDVTFQQDGAPCHTAKKTCHFLESNDIKYIHPEDWPPNSPDLNPIENLWANIQNIVSKRKWKTQSGYERAIRDEWFKVTPDELHALIGSMPRRIAQCKKAGGSTFKL